MLKSRLIPKLQLKRRQIGDDSRYVLVTTVRFDKIRDVGDPVSQAKIYQDQAADELIFLDLDAGSEKRPPAFDLLERISEEIFMPFTVGGGVKSLEDFRLLLKNGADKVSINTAAVKNPQLIRMSSDMFGAQCVVVSIDFKINNQQQKKVFIQNGLVPTDLDPVDWARKAEDLGAGELLLTSIDNDGMKNGLDIETISKITSAVSIPVIASGGCGIAAHFVEGFKVGHVSAVAAGSFFCSQDQTPMQTRSHIKNAGVPIRIET